MIRLTINGKRIRAKENLTLLDVCKQKSISIPTLCYHPELTPYGACRLCIVEVIKDGRCRIVTSCNYPVQEGIEVLTDSEKVNRYRKIIIELLLARYPNVIIIQRLAKKLGVEKTRFHSHKTETKCILCGLCIRTCHEIVGAKAIGFSQKGIFKKVDIPFGDDLDQCIACGACEFVCPTGAIKMELKGIQRLKLLDIGLKRYCRYMRLGLIDFMICSNGFECRNCEVDQRMEDLFGTHPAFALKPEKNRSPINIDGFIFSPELLYDKQGLWLRPTGPFLKIGLDGISSCLSLGIDSINLKPIGYTLSENEIFIEMMSSKGRIEFFSPIEGEIISLNHEVLEFPNLIWKDPYNRGWLIMIKQEGDIDLKKFISGKMAKGLFEEKVKRLTEFLDQFIPDNLKKEKGFDKDNWLKEIAKRKWSDIAKIIFKERFYIKN